MNADLEDPDHPVTYEPLEFLFPLGESFKHFDLKWINYNGMKTKPGEDSLLADQLMYAWPISCDVESETR